MSVLTSPQDSNFDDIKLFCPKIAEALGMNAAVMIQQLHYWTNKKVGVVVEGKRYIYNTYNEWTKEQFSWLSPYQFRKHMAKLRSLGIVEVIRYRKQQYNQTNYYHLNYDCLYEYLNWDKPENTALVDVCETTHRDNKECLIGLAKTAPSYTKIKFKENQQKETAKQKKEKIAAAPPQEALEKEKYPQQENTCPPQLTAPPGPTEPQSKQIEQEDLKEKSTPVVDQIVNVKWEKLVPELDKAGIPINQTVTNLLKLYPKEQVESAISLVKARKREQHIPNLAGYFVAAVKQDWATQKVTSNELLVTSNCSEIDSASVFRHWYDLAKELGYCSGQEMRDGEQWVLLSGSWEKWSDAVARGYSLEYLKKIIKRNRS